MATGQHPGPGSDAAVAQSLAGMATTAASIANGLAVLAQGMHGFPSAIQDITAHSISAAQPASNAVQAANAANPAGAFAELMAALDDLKAAAQQAQGIGSIGMHDGDPMANTLAQAAQEALGVLASLDSQADAANSGGGNTGTGGDSDSGN